MADVPVVRHNEPAQRFEADVDGRLALATYRRDGDVLLMTHTEVPPAAQGRGIAAALVAAALQWARAEGLWCDRCAATWPPTCGATPTRRTCWPAADRR